MVYEFKNSSSLETIELQPGEYHAVFRAYYSKKSIFTIEKNFKVIENESKQILFD
jgi:hypothetical protein